MAFGPSAVIVQRPTFDHAAVLRAINELSLGGGTSLATGILTSLDAIAGKTLKVNTAALNEDNSNEVNIGYYGGATIVLFSDGEDTSQSRPGDDGAAGVDCRGAHPDHRRRHRGGHDRARSGASASPRRWTPQTLEDVAKVTNGAYHQVDDQAALADVSKTINLHFTVVSQYTQISAMFAAAAALLLAVGALLSVLWFGRVM